MGKSEEKTVLTYSVFVTTIDGRRIKLEAGVGREEAEMIRDSTFGVFRHIEVVEDDTSSVHYPEM